VTDVLKSTARSARSATNAFSRDRIAQAETKRAQSWPSGLAKALPATQNAPYGV
jgi:hypothetical protein